MSVLNHASPSTALSNAALTLRPSACPGLLRVVAARDGGICRIKLPGGELDAAQAMVIADASAQHAAGVIEVTNRANLQVRGVRSGHESALIAALVEAGLGPAGAAGGVDAAGGLSASAADDVRNVMVSPAAGRDPFALFDTRPLTLELLALLQSEPRFAALSPKFALLLDGGERLARLDHPHDVWLAAWQRPEGVRFAFGLAGCPPAAASVTAADALATVLPAQVVPLTRALLHTFLDLADAEATRMRHLLATRSVDAVLRRAQTYVDFPLSRDPLLAGWQRAPADASLRLGVHAQRATGTAYAGGQPPLGRLDAATLRGLATLARQHGNGTLRMTPWQSVLLPDIPADAAPAVLAAMNALGLAVDPTQPVARVIACAGSAGCAKSLADTKADALRLAVRLPDGVDVHLSGCPRSCAAAHCAPFTLLAVAPGTYDLYRRDGQPGFGHCVAHQLTIEQAADMLEHLARSPLDA
ncbi:precorrin-3B synthase [Paraburkholderia fungorum]|uniref:precorrin-3B synthase n=1 Tax=Paraburkholderia fungorum TaxID=134537 RepID=UPI0038BC127A